MNELTCHPEDVSALGEGNRKYSRGQQFLLGDGQALLQAVNVHNKATEEENAWNI